MQTGMLWFDNSPSALSVKIQRAAEYYHKKYGRTPDLCLVHPSMFGAVYIKDAMPFDVGNITVRPYRPVLPGHIWIGIEDKQ